MGIESVAAVAQYLRAHHVDPPSRALVLHYRAGRLPAGWQNRLTRGTMRRHVGAQAEAPSLFRGARLPLPREAFWNSFWRILAWKAARDTSTRLCRDEHLDARGRRRGAAGGGGGGGGGGDGGQKPMPPQLLPLLAQAGLADQAA